MDYLPRRVLVNAVGRLDRDALAERLEAVRALSAQRGLRYLNDKGQARTIDIPLIPWIVTTAQLKHFYGSVHLLVDALHRVAAEYPRRPAIRSIVRLSVEQEAWLRLSPRARARPFGVIGRMDSTAVFDHAAWAADYRMLEPNAVGVGGVHYSPNACQLMLEVMRDVLVPAVGGRALTPTPDPRMLLLGELESVARRIRQPLRSVAFIENTDFTTGTDEFGHLAAHFKRLGLKAVVADPRSLKLVRGRIVAGGTPVDLLYRDSELSEFIEMEGKGARLTALRAAIKQGRLISSLPWELDQKSVWELFTDERHKRLFTPAQRRFFARHLLWTRLVREERVSDPGGKAVDLIPYIRRRRASLVLKPSTLFGGEGVIIGRETTQRAWERELGRALRGHEPYVVQSLAKIQRQPLPLPGRRGPGIEEYATVSGFFFSSAGIGLVGRFSPRTVVNVSQGGGLIPALWLR